VIGWRCVDDRSTASDIQKHRHTDKHRDKYAYITAPTLSLTKNSRTFPEPSKHFSRTFSYGTPNILKFPISVFK